MRKLMLLAAAIFIASIVCSNAAEFKRVTEKGYDVTYVCRGQDIFTNAGQQVSRQVCGWQTQALEIAPGVYGSYWLGELPEGPTNGPRCPPGFDCSYDIGNPRTRVTVNPQGQDAGWHFNEQNFEEQLDAYSRANPVRPYTQADVERDYQQLWKEFKEVNP